MELQFAQALHDLVWGAPMLILLMGAGTLFTAVTGCVQIQRFRAMLHATLGAFRKRDARLGSLTPFQALTTALAGTVGTGNIVGVSGAIALGGPGAVFWMWLSALLGMATKYAEVMLAVRFRRKNARGEWVGGPMYYIRDGLPRRLHFLAPLFAALAALAALGIGNMVQANAMAESISSAICALLPAAAPHRGQIALTAGILAAFVAGLVLLGGARRIGRTTEMLVPFMSALYVVGALWVVGTHAHAILPALRAIVEGAFRPTAALGGAAGIGIAEAIRHGVGRGTFSNEAGMGSAPIAHASAEAKSPAEQGLLGMFEVFLDTIVMCTLTALMILTSGVPIGAGVEVAVSAFATAFGPAAAPVVALMMVLFALSTIFGWSLYGERSIAFLLGERAILPYRALFVLLVAAGSVVRLEAVWALAGALNGLMALPNLVALVSLSPIVRQLSQGKSEPPA